VTLTGQPNMPGVMEIIIPLRPVATTGRIAERVEHARLIIVVLQNEMDQPICRSSKFTGDTTQLFKKRRMPRLGNRMNGVEAKPVKPVVA